jgi:hypothetical protein
MMGRSGNLAWRNVRCRGSHPAILAGSGCALRAVSGAGDADLVILNERAREIARQESDE